MQDGKVRTNPTGTNTDIILSTYESGKFVCGLTRPPRPCMDYAKTLKLRLRVGDLDLLQRRNKHNGSREKEQDHKCDLGARQLSSTHIVGEYEMYEGGTGCVKRWEK